MNERVAALLWQLAEDPALRARFVEDGRSVMAEAGLTVDERAELARHVDADGTVHTGSIIPSDEPLPTAEGTPATDEIVSKD
jgi:hypothetical protein